MVFSFEHFSITIQSMCPVPWFNRSTPKRMRSNCECTKAICQYFNQNVMQSDAKPCNTTSPLCACACFYFHFIRNSYNVCERSVEWKWPGHARMANKEKKKWIGKINSRTWNGASEWIIWTSSHSGRAQRAFNFIFVEFFRSLDLCVLFQYLQLFSGERSHIPNFTFMMASPLLFGYKFKSCTGH